LLVERFICQTYFVKNFLDLKRRCWDE